MADDLGTGGLRLEREGPIAWCTIDRPSARNAFTPAMYYGIKQAVRLVNSDPDFPAPLEDLPGRPVWTRAAIRARARRVGRPFPPQR